METKYKGTHIRVYSPEKTVLTTNTDISPSVVAQAVLELVDRLEAEARTEISDKLNTRAHKLDDLSRDAQECGE